MLIKKYEVEVFTPSCEPGAERFVAKAKLEGDISEVLPFLNATLAGVEYHPAANALTWKKAGHKIVFHAFEIATSDAEDRDGAENEIKEMVDLVNQTWDRRDEITPSLAIRKRPAPMAIYQLLPQTNCKQCNEASCWIFAAKLSTSQKTVADCPFLFEVEYTEQRTALEEMIN